MVSHGASQTASRAASRAASQLSSWEERDSVMSRLSEDEEGAEERDTLEMSQRVPPAPAAADDDR